MPLLVFEVEGKEQLAVWMEVQEHAWSRSVAAPGDPRFRDHVLTAYEFRCAICVFDVRLGNETVGLEAAHIKWHQNAGPDTADNGLALCSIHHKVFDRGVFTISDEGVMVVSDHANGSEGLESVLLRFHGRPIREAQRPEWLPNPQFLDWHRREVFRGMARA